MDDSVQSINGKSERKHKDIAIIGVGLKIADATNLEDFWKIFDDNIDCVRAFPENRRKQVDDYARVFLGEDSVPEYYDGTYLDNIDEFDNEFFKISPREAQVMEPCQRLLLETICETFDNAGYSQQNIKGSKTGIFIGYSSGSFKDSYLMDISFKHPELLKYSMVGNMPAVLPARASHILDLHGPGMVLDTACSSSLVAINEACESIINQTSTMAIAGGVKLNLLPIITKDTQLGFESNDSKTRTFEAGASGTSIGEGIACILLKSLDQAIQDKDHIYAVIKGKSINHDGTAMGITAPNPVAQTNVILDALRDADMTSDEIDYIETHGTATILGDPIELQGLKNAFSKFTDKKQFCALSASKSNLGHLYEAAGMASVLKAIAAIQYKKIPGMKNFLQPNIMLGLCESPFYINTKSKEWVVPDGKLRACGVSAFGISGTNCHLIMQEYKEQEIKEEARPMDIVCISAKDKEAFVEVIHSYRTYLSGNEISMNQFAVNVNCYKMHYQLREAIVFENKQQLLLQLEQLEKKYNQSDMKFQKATQSDPKFISEQIEDCNELFCHYNECFDKVEAMNSLQRILVELGKEYVAGNNLEWSKLYKGFNKMRIVLPCYPFKKAHFWLPMEETAKKIQSNQTITENPLFYKRSFIQKDNEVQKEKIGNCLVVRLAKNNCESLYERLSKKFNQVMTVAIDERMLIVLDVAAYMSSLFKKIDFSSITHIVFTRLFENEQIDNESELRNYEKISLLAVTALYRNIASSMWNNNVIHIVQLMKEAFVVTGEEKALRPENASVFGYCKAMNREYKNLHVTSIDFDDATDLDLISNEICSNGDLDIICYRDGKRYVEKIEEVIIPYEQEDHIIRDKGIYVITGGTSGIGFETAMELLRRKENLTIILINRSPMPKESEWEHYLQVQAETKVSRRIANLLELKKYANHVEYYACDIADANALHEVIEDVNRKYGKINGVFHAAGIGGGTNLEGLVEKRVMEMISPKIMGTYILDHETRNQNLDFFVMFSSISTIFSSSDLPDYIAGNVFMDSYCEYRKRTEKGISLTVNWATWCETGMSVEHNFTMDTLFRAIKTKQGMKGLFDALHYGSGNIVIGELNLDDNMGLLLKKYKMEFSDYILQKVALLEEKQKVDREEAKQAAKSYTGGYGTVERKLCDICCKVLGYTEINIFDNFFELGADSIMLGYIFNEVDAVYPNMVKVTDLFSRPTVKTLAEYLIELGADKLEEMNVQVENDTKEEEPSVLLDGNQIQEDYSDEDIAIIGVGMNLPNANSLDEYWSLLFNGINVVREIPNEHREEIEKHIQYTHHTSQQVKFRKCAYLDNINQFDYTYFGMSPREASLVDPVNRLFLQCCATAIDDAGYGRDGVKGSKTGIFLGFSSNVGSAYSRLLYEADEKLFNASLSLNQVSMSASKVAYLFDLKGPSMVIDTACSSSLVSIHMACQQIRNGECDMALAGGASIALAPVADKFSVGFESEEEKTRAFADESTGTAVGEGVGVVLLKPLKKALQDKDAIYAVIKGSAINQDGSSFGIAAPNYEAQSEAIQHAWKNARVSPMDITYIEAHGTGTSLGDPIEVRGITDAFNTVTNEKQICGIGSLKTNIGHLNEASGVSGILKIILMLKYKIIPPSLNLLVPNRNIDFLDSPLYVITKKTELKPKGNHVIVGINGFGMSGTNCHMILEEPPVRKESDNVVEKGPYFLTISAKSTMALKSLLFGYKEYAEKNPEMDLAAFCYNLNVGRHHTQYRVAFLFHSQEELLSKLGVLVENYPYVTNLKDCYVGRFAIVPENKSDCFEYEITLQQQEELTKKAKQNILSYKESQDVNYLNELLKEYITGAEIVWKNMYNHDYKKMHLPSYPYDKHHCWYHLPEIIKEENEENIELDSYFYEKKWVSHDAEDFSGLNCGDIVVVIYNQRKTMGELTNHLLNHGIKVIEVYEDNVYEKIDNNRYTIPSNVEGYQQFFQELKERKIEIKALVHMKSIYDGSSAETEEITEKVDNGFFDVIALINGVSKAHYNQKIEIVIIANNAYSIEGNEDYLIPENAMILSMGKVIEQEYTNINCRAIDMDEHTSVELIEKELFVTTNLYITGFRNNARYSEELNEADIERVCDNLFREEGVYIVTGGASGIGRETVKYLSRQVNAHIHIITRSGKEVTELTKYVKDNKGTIDYYACDVGDYRKLKEIYDEIKKKHGKVDGIIHSAGISGAGYILRKERESYEKVFQPKVYGAWNLDQISKDDKLDFMILYSSAVTDSGEAGQSDYVAANSYLDAFTDYRNSQGRKTMSINWVSWKETGMSVVHGINVDSATKAITTKEGIHALDEFLHSSTHRVMIGQFNVDDNFLALSQYSKNLASKSIADKIGKLILKRQEALSTDVLSDGNRNFAQIKDGKLIFIPKSDKIGKNKKILDQIKLTGDYTNHYTDTEKIIGEVYSQILGYEEINVFDNFFEMGGDSVMLSEMHSNIDKMYQDYITVADLFEYTSVRTLAEYIDSKNATEEIAVMDDVEFKKEEMDKETSCYLATKSQQRIYYDCRISKDKQIYNNPFVSDISEFPGDIEAVLNKIIQRHEILRTYFYIEKSKLMQCVLPNLTIKVNYEEVDDIEQVDFNSYLQTFDLKEAPLFHATVFLGKNQEKVLLFDIHHILVDGYSSSIFQKEMLDLTMGRTLEAPIYQYRDYVAFEQEFLNTNEFSKIKKYWSERLKTYDEKHFPTKVDVERKVTYDSLEGSIGEELEEELRQFSRENNVSLFTVLYSALTLAMAIQLDSDDIVLLVPVLNRYRPRFNQIMGVFVNMIPIRNCIDKKKCLKEYLAEVGEFVEKDLRNQFCDYSDIMAELKQDFGDKNYDFEAFFDFEDSSIKKIKDKKEVSIDQIRAKKDIDISIRKYNQNFKVEITYKENLYDRNIMESLLDLLQKILICYSQQEAITVTVEEIMDSTKREV